MRTLQQLKDTWFLTPTSFEEYGLNIRHDNTSLNLYTDNNEVSVLVDFSAYASQWFDLVQLARLNAPDSMLLFSVWSIDNIETVDVFPFSKAMDLLIDAAGDQVTVYALINGDVKHRKTMTERVNTLLTGGVHAVLDTNFPTFGSAHHKALVCKVSDIDAQAIFGSLDIGDFNKDPGVHEVAIKIKGPAVFDIEQTFFERWDSPYNDPIDYLEPPVNSYPNEGTHSVQILRTYGEKSGYPSGEFSVWASYLNAIKNAERYIYIEDQYFQGFDWPVCYKRGEPDVLNSARDTDLVYQLGKAIENGVKVAVLTNYFKVGGGYNKDNYDRKVANYQRELSVLYLQDIAGNLPEDATGDFVVGRLSLNNNHHYIHSKLMLVDDEFSIVGSANFEQRSMTNDSELCAGIIDPDNLFTKELRITLLIEHLKIEGPTDGIDDWSDAYDQLKSSIQNSNGNVMPLDLTGEYTYWHGYKLRNIVAPYAGPQQLR